MVGGGGRSFVRSVVGGPLWLVPFLVQGRRKGGKGRTRAEGNPKGEKEEGRRRPLFLVTISPSSSLAVNAPPRPSLPFGGNQSCGDHDKSVEDGGCAARKRERKERTSFIASLLASMLLLQEVPFNRARDGMNK